MAGGFMTLYLPDTETCRECGGPTTSGKCPFCRRVDEILAQKPDADNIKEFIQRV